MKKHQQVLRTKEIPNESLSILMDRVNLLSGNESLEELQVKDGEISSLLENQHFKKNPNYDLANLKSHQARLELKRVLDMKPSEFKKYIWGNAKPQINLLKKISDPEFDISNLRLKTAQAVKRYEDFRELNEQIRGLAGELRYLRNWKDPRIKVNKEQQFIPFEFLTVGSGIVYYEIDEAGLLQFTFDELSTALKGVEARRIRECEVCLCIFWAGRVDKVCCSDKCNSTHNVRKFRKRYQENKAQINKERQEHKKRKKKLKALKEF